MALFTAGTTHVDPYKNFRFRVKWDNTYVAGLSQMGALSQKAEVVKSCEGGDPSVIHLSPGQTSYDPIKLERGVSYDAAFEQWANKAWYYPNTVVADADKDLSLEDFRKDIIIEVYNEAGQKVLTYTVYRCWVSEYIAMPELDTPGSAIAIQSITLQNEGWERNTSVTDQAEPTFTKPSS